MANLMSILLALDLFFFFFRSNANLTDVDFLIEEVNEKKKIKLTFNASHIGIEG